MWNADYWYSQAGRTRPDIPLDEEWKLLVDEMLQNPGLSVQRSTFTRLWRVYLSHRHGRHLRQAGSGLKKLNHSVSIACNLLTLNPEL